MPWSGEPTHSDDVHPFDPATRAVGRCADVRRRGCAGRRDLQPCPNHVYSNTISAKEAKDKGCTVLDNAPITVIQGIKPKATTGTASATTASGAAKIDPAEQRARDSDAKRILEAELKREEERLAAMKTEYNNGTPDRQGNEVKNFQRYTSIAWPT